MFKISQVSIHSNPHLETDSEYHRSVSIAANIQRQNISPKYHILVSLDRKLGHRSSAQAQTQRQNAGASTRTESRMTQRSLTVKNAWVRTINVNMYWFMVLYCFCWISELPYSFARCSVLKNRKSLTFKSPYFLIFHFREKSVFLISSLHDMDERSLHVACSLQVVKLILAPCTVPCMCSGWSLHPVLFLACVQADPCTQYCSLHVFRLILAPCTVPCMCSGWSLHPVLFLACVQADPCTLYCSLHVFRLILAPCTVPCRWSGWSLHPVLFLEGVQADPYTLYCSL